MSNPIPKDTRGIIDPVEMMRHVDFVRSPAGETLDGLVEWFWSVEWRLPDGFVHNQQVLSHPAGNISIGTIDDSGVCLDPAEGRVYGVTTSLGERRLANTGWTVAARSTVGGLGVLLNRSAKSMVDGKLDLELAVPGIEGARLVAGVNDEISNDSRVKVLRNALGVMVAERDASKLAEAREIAAVARLAEQDRSVHKVEQLAVAAGVSVRTLQRLFDFHVGVGPSFVIRRWRIIEAAESAKIAMADSTEWKGWANVANELGYSDQAHLTRDFRRHLGTSPAAYVREATKETV